MFGLMHISGNPDAKTISLSPLTPLFENFSAKPALMELKSGDFLRVFKSITEGEEFLTVDIDYEIDPENTHEYQKGIDRQLWVKMFRTQMPAKLTKPDGSVVDGQLHVFMDGGGWAIYDFEDKSYESVHFLQKGDRLTIYSAITDGLPEWEGRLEIEETPEIYACTYVTPPLELLDRWSLLHRPAKLTR